jgi:hypothetical protein
MTDEEFKDKLGQPMTHIQTAVLYIDNLDKLLRFFHEKDGCNNALMFVSSPYWIDALGIPEYMDTHTGERDGQKECEQVIYFPKIGRYYKRSGSFHSYQGTVWDENWYKTYPQHVIKTIYL